MSDYDQNENQYRARSGIYVALEDSDDPSIGDILSYTNWTQLDDGDPDGNISRGIYLREGKLLDKAKEVSSEAVRLEKETNSEIGKYLNKPLTSNGKYIVNDLKLDEKQYKQYVDFVNTEISSSMSESFSNIDFDAAFYMMDAASYSRQFMDDKRVAKTKQISKELFSKMGNRPVTGYRRILENLGIDEDIPYSKLTPAQKRAISNAL